MEYTNEILEKMDEKHEKFNKKYSRYYYRISEEEKDLNLIAERYKKRAERIGSCLNYWTWDVYHKNKTMDLKDVNRCMNNRFCPNCRTYDLALFIHNFRPLFTDLLKEGYTPYLLTLTIPNCEGKDLKDTIDKLNYMFRRLNNGFSYPLNDSAGKKGIPFRLFEYDGSLKVLEITYNKITRTYHPHFHCIIFSYDKMDKQYLKKKIVGHYSNKRNSFNLHSHYDIHIAKIWTMIYNKIRLTEKNYSLMSNDPKELLQVDFKEMDEKGIYEVLKYTFKDTDIINKEVFEVLVRSLENKRIRQGYGILYNLKTELEDDNGEYQELDLEIKENPEQLLTQGIKTLYTEYRNYKKISRYKANISDEIINLER